MTAKRSLAAAATMEALVNSYIKRALSSPEELTAIDDGFGGLDEVQRDSNGMPKSETELAHAIARRVLGANWWYTLNRREETGELEVVILGGF